MPPLRALVLEDDPSLATLIARLLARVSITCSAVGTLSAAEGALAEGRFDVLIVDSQLPDGDGFELLLRLRARGVDTPALLVSGTAIAPPDARTLFLAKPFSKSSLPSAVLELIEGATTSAT